METNLIDPEFLLRIIQIVFPVFAIVLLGWFYGKYRAVDMAAPNQTNMDIFIPALVFSALADKSFDLVGHQVFAIAAFVIMAGSGFIGWLVARATGISHKILVPTTMFNNCGNLGLPLAYLAFGQEGLAAAVVMFLISNLLHFSFGNWLLDHGAKWWNAWKHPVILAALAGLAVSLSGFDLWDPLQIAIKMLGDVSIPLALLALGVRIAQSHPQSMHAGFIGAFTRPIAGVLLAWPLSILLGLEGQAQAILILFGALPPAMINYVFAERYNQGPDEVAAIVLVGNVSAVLIIPLVLAIVL
jgi:malate permease and related proteins